MNKNQLKKNNKMNTAVDHKKPLIVISPKSNGNFTKDKEYCVIGFHDDDCDEDLGYGFTIINDLGETSFCNERFCPQIQNSHWVIKTTER